MTDVASAISEGDYSVDVPDSGRLDELGQLMDSLRAMILNVREVMSAAEQIAKGNKA